MKFLFPSLALLVGAASLALGQTSAGPEPERVLVITTGNYSELTRLLSEGWTVKHQSVAMAGAGAQLATSKEFQTTAIFTLTPPSPEVLAAAKAKRDAEWQAKRAEFLRKRAEQNAEGTR